MVKFQTDNKTYLVTKGGTLRWAKTAERGAADVISCLEGFPAKHLARRREVEIFRPKTFGLKCSE
jgi:hypothetical protein